MIDYETTESCGGECLTRWWNLPLGTFLLLVPFISYLCTSALWFLGFTLSRWVLLPGIIGAFAIVFFYRKSLSLSGRKLSYVLVSFLLLLISGTCISEYIYDYAYDGMLYHQPIIYSLMNGWNPVYETESPYFKGEYFASFVNYYPKGMETMAAVFASFFQNIEAGKIVNWLFLSSSFCLSSYFVNNLFREKLASWKKVVLTILLCYSPVTIVQLCTFYVDWSLYFILLAIIVFLYDLAHAKEKSRIRMDEILIGVLMAMAASIKITVMFWATAFLVVLFVFGKVQGYFKQWRSLVATGILGGLLGFFVLAFNPYMCNVLGGKYLFYPFLGEQAVNVDAVQEQALEGYDRIESVLMSLVSRPSSNQAYKGPFDLSIDSAIQSGKAEVKLGGFGLFFFEILLLGIVLYLSCYKKDRKWYLAGVGLSLLFLALLVLPNGWWARFTPFFYFFPLFCLFYGVKFGGNFVRKGCKVMVLLMVVNIGVTQASAMGLMFIHRSKVHYLMEVLEKSPQPIKMYCHNWTLHHQLEQHNIQTIACDTLSAVLTYPGSPVKIDPIEWKVDKVNKDEYFFLKYSNIKDSIYTADKDSSMK